MKVNISKTQIALVQVQTSIELYNNENYISAITLAGAAEEIFGKIAKAKTGINSIIGVTQYFNQMADDFKAENVTEQQIADIRNKVRNELKHNDKGDDSIVEDNFRSSAKEFIISAIRNYETAFGTIPEDDLIKKFWNGDFE